MSQRPSHVRNAPPLVVIGTGRSGTTYIVKWLQALGFDASHETFGGKDANVGGVLSVYRDEWPADCRVLHVVREPMACIASLRTCSDDALKWRRENFPVDRSWRRRDGYFWQTQFWVYCNAMCEGLADRTVRLDQVTVADLGDWLGLPEGYTEPDIPKNTNTRPNSRKFDFSWEDLERMDPRLAVVVRRQAERYGFETDRSE